jgi:hypothetical protein
LNAFLSSFIFHLSSFIFHLSVPIRYPLSPSLGPAPPPDIAPPPVPPPTDAPVLLPPLAPPAPLVPAGAPVKSISPTAPMVLSALTADVPSPSARPSEGRNVCAPPISPGIKSSFSLSPTSAPRVPLANLSASSFLLSVIVFILP